MRTLADLINDYLAPEQPDYCREASLALLVPALHASGPVVYRGQVASIGKDDAFELEPREFRDETTSVDDGGEQTTIESAPTDPELAAAWGMKAACETPVPAEGQKTVEPEADEHEAHHKKGR